MLGLKKILYQVQNFKLLSIKYRNILESNVLRTHTCGELRIEDLGKIVTVVGWLETPRVTSKEIIFIPLRDHYSTIQIVSTCADICSLIRETPVESVIQVVGIVQSRPKPRLDMPTGKIEILASQINILNLATNLPFRTSQHSIIPLERLHMNYRHVFLRRRENNEMLMFRSSFIHYLRNFLHAKQFIEIETPTLFKCTPEGANEFIVPSRHHGEFYSLTQSPQQFKQLLMVSGIDKYFQVARCYRNEGQRADRQPEFTQLDIEMAFITAEQIQNLIEDMLTNTLRTSLPSAKIKSPFSRMKYSEAINLYQTDKPDLRQSQLQVQFSYMSSEISIFISIPKYQLLSAKNKNKIEQDLQNMSIQTGYRFSILKPENIGVSFPFEITALDAVCKVEGSLDTSDFKSMHLLLYHIATIFDNSGIIARDPNEFSFVWITDFPLFTKSSGTGEITSTHHPFTAPVSNQVDKLSSNPLEIISQSYDLVLNGCEIAGGSIRIHNADMQEYVIREILKQSTDSLNHLIDALRHGCPPHGGIAIGLDRLIALILNKPSIRDVVAFPKSFNSRDKTVNAPSKISEEILRKNGIKLY